MGDDSTKGGGDVVVAATRATPFYKWRSESVVTVCEWMAGAASDVAKRGEGCATAEATSDK